jgi:hypothetical protein
MKLSIPIIAGKNKRKKPPNIKKGGVAYKQINASETL